MKLKLYDSENNFCRLLWEKGPLSRRELMDLCRLRLGWKGSVTRTAIRRMVKRGAVKVENGVVSMLVDQKDTEVTARWCLFDLLHGGSAAPGVVQDDQMSGVEVQGGRRIIDRSMFSTPGMGGGQHGSVTWPH